MVLAITGCSLTVSGPTDTEIAMHKRIDCTATPVAPIVDTLPAGVGIVGGGLVIASAESTHSDWSHGLETVGVSAIIVGVLYAVSAVHGFRAVSACQDLE